MPHRVGSSPGAFTDVTSHWPSVQEAAVAQTFLRSASASAAAQEGLLESPLWEALGKKAAERNVYALRVRIGKQQSTSLSGICVARTFLRIQGRWRLKRKARRMFPLFRRGSRLSATRRCSRLRG